MVPVDDTEDLEEATARSPLEVIDIHLIGIIIQGWMAEIQPFLNGGESAIEHENQTRSESVMLKYLGSISPVSQKSHSRLACFFKLAILNYGLQQKTEVSFCASARRRDLNQGRSVVIGEQVRKRWSWKSSCCEEKGGAKVSVTRLL